MSVTLNDAVRALLDGPNFAVLATVDSDGTPHTSVMWVGREGDDVVFSTVAGRRKERNIRRDPRVSVTVLGRDDPYHYAEIGGSAVIETSGGPELNDTLSWTYDGRPFGAEPPNRVRVVIRVTPQRLSGYAARPA